MASAVTAATGSSLRLCSRRTATAWVASSSSAASSSSGSSTSTSTALPSPFSRRRISTRPQLSAPLQSQATSPEPPQDSHQFTPSLRSHQSRTHSPRRPLFKRNQNPRSSPFEPSSRALTPIPDLHSLQAWFSSHFPFLALPGPVILQAITHESYNMGRNIRASESDNFISAGAHNRRLSFLGRRAMQAFLALFLHSIVASPTASPESRRTAEQILQAPDALDVLLHTVRMGDRVGRTLELEQVMRWTPVQIRSEDGHAAEPGLFRVRGRALEAFLGAIYHEHGANLASQTFHAYVLPHLDSFPASTPRSLWDEIKARADADARELAGLTQWAAEKRLALGYSS